MATTPQTTKTHIAELYLGQNMVPKYLGSSVHLFLPGVVLLTWLADLTKRPPMWGISTDGLRIVKAGSMFDGSKAEEELGIIYTPIRVALEEAITSYKE